MKEMYQTLEMEVIEFASEDVITTSGDDDNGRAAAEQRALEEIMGQGVAPHNGIGGQTWRPWP